MIRNIFKLIAVTAIIGTLSQAATYSIPMGTDPQYQTRGRPRANRPLFEKISHLKSIVIRGTSKDALRNILMNFEDINNTLQKAIRVSNQENIKTMRINPEGMAPRFASNDPRRFFSERDQLNIRPNVESEVRDFEASIRDALKEAVESLPDQRQCTADMWTKKVTQVLKLVQCGMNIVKDDLQTVVDTEGSLFEVIQLNQAIELIFGQGKELLERMEVESESELNEELNKVERNLECMMQKLRNVLERKMREVEDLDTGLRNSA